MYAYTASTYVFKLCWDGIGATYDGPSLRKVQRSAFITRSIFAKVLTKFTP